MAPLDFLKGIKNKLRQKKEWLKEMNFDETKRFYESEARKRGITASFFDDNNVCVRNKDGKELVAEFPTEKLSLGEYDAFVHRMQDSRSPLPDIHVIRPVVTTSSLMGVGGAHDNDQAERTDITPSVKTNIGELAKELGVDIEEMKFISDFAMFKLYERFKARLRDRKPDS